MSSQRIERCYTDNIYLIESLPSEDEYERRYLIMGNSGNTYKVTIAKKPNCTCPDYRTRRNRCKHIFFVLIRIMNINNFTDRQFSEEELVDMFSNIPDIPQNLIYQGERPEEPKAVNQKFDKGDVCPICLDPLENGKDLDYCRFSCGKTIHSKCFSMWERTKGSICVFCRADWHCNNLIIRNHKKVSMHPIQPKENIEKEKEKENKNPEENKENENKNQEKSKENENKKEKENKEDLIKKEEIIEYQKINKKTHRLLLAAARLRHRHTHPCGPDRPRLDGCHQ